MNFANTLLQSCSKGAPPPLSAPSVSFTRTLKRRDSGDDVTRLQTILIFERLLPSNSNLRYFGPLTEQAVKAYQAKYQIEQTGIVGPLTMVGLEGRWYTFDVETNVGVKKKIVAILVAVSFIVVVALLLFVKKETPPSIQSDSEKKNLELESIVEASKEISKTYTDTRGRFSFKYPESFLVNQFEESDTEIIVIQDTKKSIGLQITISRGTDGMRVITPELLAADIPDMKITDAKIIMKRENAQGLMFTSDNPAYGGDSREAWFYTNEFLYQLSTYSSERLLLEHILATWSIDS